jgi:hypothetical protein
MISRISYKLQKWPEGTPATAEKANLAKELRCQRTTHPLLLTNIYEHYVENFSNKSLLHQAIIYIFDKFCQNTIIQNG